MFCRENKEEKRMRQETWARKWLRCLPVLPVLAFALALVLLTPTGAKADWHTGDTCPVCRGQVKVYYDSSDVDRDTDGKDIARQP